MKTLASIIFLLVLLHSRSAIADDQPTHPVVLIPGILGSKLCTTDKKVLWGESARASLANLHLLEITSQQAGKIESCGIVDKVQVLGPLYSVAAYSSLLKAMREWKLVDTNDDKNGRKRNLYIFHYDWRLSNVDNADRLERFIRDNLGPDRDFNIVAHSMGGLVARLYMDRHKPKLRVKKIVYLGTPFLGSMSTLGTLSEGWGTVPNWVAGGMDTIRRVVLSFPSLLELLPRYDHCCSFKSANGAYTAIDVFDPQLWKANAWLPSDMQDNPRFGLFARQLKQAGSLSPLFRSPAPAGIIEVRFASDSRSTRFIFTARQGQTSPGVDNWHFSYERGDATVPAWSAARNPELRSLASALQSFGEHSTIFDDDWVRSELKRELLTANAILDRPIAGKGYPVIQVKVGGQRREWSIERVQLRPHATYLAVGATLQAAVELKFSGNARDFTSGAYLPRVVLRQNGRTLPLQVTETTTAADKGNRLLAFTCRGNTQVFAEGVAELALELPSSQPASAAKEYVVLLK